MQQDEEARPLQVEQTTLLLETIEQMVEGMQGFAFARVVAADRPLAEIAARTGLPDDNFVVFAAVRLLMDASLALLQMNREHCGICGHFAPVGYRTYFSPFRR